ncbi:biotin transporter BioY [Natranaerobius thermophilus]|uniref:Biotin transporter n=1 Tax=Natranaerobius thermophilus (strain ATCC BAA-1301 / DSM 18059 / JW/NM-WN-LF) TaxID=457570 RepID=B2A4V9_NATTJ|nr:biotin transporter BioY [Natranaerobius thermophilus]ACB83881.1 BioY protein [Natranaerobius thermophilus JW/NM-WN-LF]
MNSNIRDLVVISLFAAVTGVLSYVYVPISPVPVTGQTMGVMLSGALLGPKRGFISQVVYLLLGVVGMPVFAGGMGGVAVLFGATGGYLWAYPFAAFIIGYIVEKGDRYTGITYWLVLVLALLTGGVFMIYTTGVLQLALVTQVPIGVAVLEGAVPFLLGDIVKITASAFVTKSCRTLSL